MKKIVLLISLFAFIFGLAACNREIDDSIESPQNIEITNGIVSWDEVSDADHYLVYVNQDDYESDTTSFDLKTLSLAEGTYGVTVVAVRDDKVSLPSSAVSYVVEGEVNETIDPPTNVTLSGDTLSWSAVTGATGYVVHVGAMTFNVSTTSLDLSTKSIPEGTFSVYVVAVKDSVTSNQSTTVSYTVETNVSQDDIKLSVLHMINSTYEPDMEEDDFIDIYAYNDYLMALDSADAYAAASIELGMTSTQAINFFDDAKDMVDGMEYMTSMDEFMTELELFDDYDMSAPDLALVVYNLLEVMINSEIRSMNLRIDENELEILDATSDISDMKSSQSYIDAYNFMKSYATVDEYDAIDMLFSGEQQTLFYATYDIQNVLIGNGGQVYLEDYSWDQSLDSSYVEDLIAVMTSMMEDEDGEAFITNFYFEIMVIQNLVYQVNWLEELQYMNDEYESEVESLGVVKTTITAQKQEIVGSLEVFFEFLFTVKDTIPQDVIDDIDSMMMGQTLTMAEMLMIKDELVFVIQSALPDATDFELVFETMITITGAASNMDVQTALEYSNFIAQTSHASVDLFLTLVGDIDEPLITGGMTILEDAQDEFGDYDFETNPKVAIDFALYVVNYLETFAVENQVKVDALSALFTYEIKEEFYVMFLDAAITQIENDMYMDPTEQDVMIGLLEDMQLEFDTYYDLYLLFEDNVSDVIGYIIDSEARIFKTFIDLDNEINPDLSVILPNLELLIEDIHMIDVAWFDEITATEIDIVFEAAKLPLKAMISMENPSVPFDTLYTELTPHLKTVILNFIDLQSDLMVQADALDLSSIILNPNVSSEQIGVAYAVVTALDLTLTTDNETMIFTSLDLVFDSILGNINVLDLMGATSAEVDDLQLNVFSDLEAMIDEIQALASLDINALTVDDENRLLELMMNLGVFPPQDPMLN